MLRNRWGEAVESSSRFATYVAFGLFCFAITIPIIRRAFFIGAILYLAIAFETVDIFLNDLLIIHVYSTHFLLADVFPAVKSTGRFSSRAFFDTGAVTVAQFDFFSSFFVPDGGAVILVFHIFWGGTGGYTECHKGHPWVFHNFSLPTKVRLGEPLCQIKPLFGRQIRLVYLRGHNITPYMPCARCTMTRIKLFMVVGAFMMGLIYFQPESAILLAAQLPATEVIAGIIVVLGTVGFALRYYQMKLVQVQNESDL